MNEQILIPLLAALAAMLIGGAILLARWSRRIPLQERLRKLGHTGSAGAGVMPYAGRNSHLPNATPDSDSDSDRTSRWQDILAFIGRLTSGSGGTSFSLLQELSQAGYHNDNAAARYLGAKFLLMTVGVIAVLTVPVSARMQVRMLFAGIVGGMHFFIPNLYITSRRMARRNEIRRHLPDAIDLLEICASSGMGLDMAWNSVAEEVRSVSPILADEMALTNLEMHLGAPRAVAMRHMAKRTGADELSSLVAVLVQSERFGTSIRDALRTYAASMRETRSQYAQEAAEKMAVKLIFPMVAFIFPAVVMVMAGPGFMMLYKALRAS
jgi:tight adherence protein C